MITIQISTQPLGNSSLKAICMHGIVQVISIGISGMYRRMHQQGCEGE